MADVRVSFDAVPMAPDQYDADNERSFRAVVDSMSLDLTRALQELREDVLADSSLDKAIDDITDIVITSPADNEVLAYDSGSGDWINQTAAEAGLAAASHTHAATDIVSGTLADARLSSNVPLKDANNVFTGSHTVQNGAIAFGTGTGSITFAIDGTDKQLRFMKGGEFRWIVQVTTDDDDGDDDGGVMNFLGRDDTGANLGTVFQLNRQVAASANAVLNGKVSIAGTNSSYSTGQLGFFGTAPITKRTGVAVTAAGIHAALVSYGLISA